MQNNNNEELLKRNAAAYEKSRYKIVNLRKCLPGFFLKSLSL